MAKQSTAKKDDGYVHTIRSEKDPAIAANIFRGTTNVGDIFLYFRISRAWKAGQREGYSDRFSPRHVDAIQEVTTNAQQWIQAHPDAMDGTHAFQPAESTSKAA